jgi:hypothetical protein
MTHTTAWLHRGWVVATEHVLERIAILALGFVMMVVGLGLGVTMIMLPVGVVVGLVGVAVFVEGVFGNFGIKQSSDA